MTTFNSRVKLKTNKQIVKIVALNSELFSKREKRGKNQFRQKIIVKNNNVTYVKIRFRKKKSFQNKTTISENVSVLRKKS